MGDVYKATVHWQRNGENLHDRGYSRRHEWRFDGGATVPASASPHVVPPPGSDPQAVDPEEAFVASLSSCHMLFFLALAVREGLAVDSYTDDAEGVLARDGDGRMAMTRVTLRPRLRFAGDEPDAQLLETLHHRAHERCFIANSVKTEVVVDCG